MQIPNVAPFWADGVMVAALVLCRCGFIGNGRPQSFRAIAPWEFESPHRHQFDVDNLTVFLELLVAMNVKYTRDNLLPIIKESRNWADVCRALGIKPATGSQTHIKTRCVKLDIDFSHFTGCAWNKGGVAVNRRPIQFYLVNHGPFVRSDYLKKRLISEGIKKPSCEACNRTEWMGKKIPLELDHINGCHEDNRPENLRILCPNCHAQTPTYCNRRGW